LRRNRDAGALRLPIAAFIFATYSNEWLGRAGKRTEKGKPQELGVGRQGQSSDRADRARLGFPLRPFRLGDNAP